MPSCPRSGAKFSVGGRPVETLAAVASRAPWRMPLFTLHEFHTAAVSYPSFFSSLSLSISVVFSQTLLLEPLPASRLLVFPRPSVWLLQKPATSPDRRFFSCSPTYSHSTPLFSSDMKTPRDASSQIRLFILDNFGRLRLGKLPPLGASPNGFSYISIVENNSQYH